MIRTVFRGEAISFGYNKQQQVLNKINLIIEDESIYGIVGAPGSGKTTLVKVMLGLEKASSGKMIWFNELRNSSTNRRIGYVPQTLALIYDLNVYENVRLFGKLYQYRGERLKKQVEQALSLVGLWDLRKAELKELSNFQLQKLNIACGIVHIPDVVIFDEVISNVNLMEKPLIMNIIKQLHELGMSIILLSKTVEDIEELCTNIIYMIDGTCIPHQSTAVKEKGYDDYILFESQAQYII